MNGIHDVGYQELFRVMKLTVFFMLLGFMAVSAESYSQAQRLNLKMQDAPIVDVLYGIEQQSEFYFFFKNNEIEEIEKVDIDFQNATIDNILSQILDNTGLSYKIVDKYIVITPETQLDADFQIGKKDVTGKVTDSSGAPLPGVTVIIKGTTNGTVTDFEGNFKLTGLNPETILQFSFVGMRLLEMPIAGKSIINITMSEDAIGIEEVVAVGYGTMKKVNLSGAINQINAEELEDRPVTTISSAIQGTIPNLNISFAGGAPGQMGSLNIRGTTSLNGGSPLVLIDGIPGTLDRLSPEEVESITVLKDAASAAIYGARGAYGVVLITTKSGKSGKTSIRYNNSFGFSTPTVSTDFLTTGYDWMKLNDDALAHVGGYSGYTEEDYQALYERRNDKTEHPDRPWITIQNRNGRDQYVYYGNFDWWKFMFNKWQPSQSHNINITRGTDKITFMLNGNMKMQDGIMRVATDKYKAYSLRSKVTAELYPWLSVSNNTNFYNSNYDYYGRSGGGNSNFVHINVHASPAYAPMNPDGTATYVSGLNRYDIGDGIFAMLLSGNTKGAKQKYELTSTSEAIITPIKDMKIVANYSYSLYTDPTFYRQVPATYSLYPGEVSVATKYSVDRLSESQQFNQVHVVNVYADYTKTLADHHNLKGLIGFNQELHQAKKISAGRYDLLSETLNDLNLATGDPYVGGGSSAYALRGVFYRLNYDYKGKYLLETNGRYDGTSRFPKGDRFGFFPSVSAAWRVSEEGFFSPIQHTISNLKLRASYGSLGNQTVNTPYPYISTLDPGTMSYIFDGDRAQYMNSPAPVAGNLTWEEVTSFNLGIDLSLFNNRLNTSFDRYVRNTSGMLNQGEKIPNVFGASQPRENIASLRTKGFELSVEWRDDFNLGNKPFRYSARFILSDNYAYITKINNPTKLVYSDYEGKRLGEIWGYVTDGFFQTDAEAKTYPVNQEWLNKIRNEYNIPLRAGDLRWVDLNGDNIIDSGENTVDNPGDQRVIGNSTPRYSYGMSANANWNNFDFSVFFQGVGKRDWYPGNNADRFLGPYSRPYYSFIPNDFPSKVWSEDNPNAYFPNLLAYIALNGNNELRATNNRYLQDLAYLRLKSMTIGYSLPKSLTKRLKIERLRVFATGENLFTWTKLESDYIDPEQAMADKNGRVYPFSKTYSFGFDITF